MGVDKIYIRMYNEVKIKKAGDLPKTMKKITGKKIRRNHNNERKGDNGEIIICDLWR